MSCPDPMPEPGSVADLLSQKAMLDQKIRAKQNEEYIASGQFQKDVVELAKICGVYPDGKETLREIIALAKKEAARTSAAYTDFLWRDK